MMRKSIFVFIMFLFFFAVRAEVFTLWPYSGGGSVLSSKVDSIPGIDREILLIEPMIVNGVRLKLEVRRIDSTFDNLILFLKGNFDPKELRAAGDTIRVAYKTGEKQVERWLIVNSGDGDLFLRANPRELMWVSYGAAGNGACYTRPY